MIPVRFGRQRWGNHNYVLKICGHRHGGPAAAARLCSSSSCCIFLKFLQVVEHITWTVLWQRDQECHPDGRQMQVPNCPYWFQLVLACPTWQSAYRLAALLTCSVFRPPHDAEPTVSSPNPTIKQGLISGVLILCHSVILLLWANPNSSNHTGEHFTTWKHISFNDFLYLSRQAWNVRRRINLVLWSFVNLWRDIKKPSGKTILWLSKDDKNAFCRIQQHLLLIKNSWERRNGGVLP